MKTFTKLLLTALVAVFSVNMFAESIVLDLTHPANPESWTWTEKKNYWADTFKDTEYETEYFESQVFAFTRNADPAYNFWYGLTVSKNASAANMASEEGGWVQNQWGCMAQGGITAVEAGVPQVSADKPYLIAYCPAFNGPEASGFIFNDGNRYMAKGMYVTNHPWAYYNVTEGDGATARKLDQEGDYLKLIVTGKLNSEVVGKVEFTLAEFKNGALSVVKDWRWFDLSPLGEVEEMYFTIDGTDVGSWGLNTASYVCMDLITVEEVPSEPTAVEENSDNADAKAFRVKSTIYGIPEGAQVYVYNLGGQLIINQTVNGGSITLPTAAPYYITKIVTESGVQTVR